MEQLKRHVTAIDISVIIISAAIALAAIFLPYLAKSHARSDVFIIDVNGEGHVYSLSENNNMEIESCGINLVVEVRDGRVGVISSDCPDGICCSSGEIFRAGQSIVCVPARVAISVIPEVSEDADWIFG